jgi:hypothetical protein
MRSRPLIPIVTFLSFLTAPAVASPILGMVDTFQSVTTEGWFAGGGPFGQFPPVPPQVVSTGGPTGANDAYLQIAATGFGGPGGRLVAMNASQWTGDFTGIPTIEMDVFNFGQVELALRLLFEDPSAGPPTNIAITTTSVAVPSGSGWMRVSLAIDALSLTALEGNVSDLLDSVTLVRLIHAPLAAFPGPPIAAVLGVDNISAGPVDRPGPFPDPTPVPEPSTLFLISGGLVIAGLASRKRRRPSCPSWFKRHARRGDGFGSSTVSRPIAGRNDATL